MKFDIRFERIYPYPIETVWVALTEPAALGQWLMTTDFVPEPGRAFQMWCKNVTGEVDRYLCKVIALEPHQRMLWSWILDGRQSDGETYVEFQLEPVANGTCLTIYHRGDRESFTIESFKNGWPSKLEQLGYTLASSGKPLKL